ncbi:hypothetical protein H8L32_07360 [Undibacterium sp. CY18W]|uniref:Uncharacterized protein n=1 Tax=Undibacterium hunanense TaxID=2762292 RepID=A0ABR6ZN16_9BURK|nr:hypothetical protein [Undibacterium hunanense]MBC3917287.1 hypothetical protein [Undibacterium hunanense]
MLFKFKKWCYLKIEAFLKFLFVPASDVLRQKKSAIEFFQSEKLSRIGISPAISTKECGRVYNDLVSFQEQPECISVMQMKCARHMPHMLDK